MRQERRNLGAPELGRVTQLVKPKKAPHPSNGGLIGPPTVIPRADRGPDLYHQPLPLIRELSTGRLRPDNRASAAIGETAQVAKPLRALVR